MADLERFEVRWPDDAAAADPRLVCDKCGKVLCDVQHEDTLAALVEVAGTHRCKPSKPWKHEGHVEVQHRDGFPPWCDGCGWSAPVPKRPAIDWKAEHGRIRRAADR